MSEQHNIENSNSGISEAAATAAAKKLALQERQRNNKRNQREREKIEKETSKHGIQYVDVSLLMMIDLPLKQIETQFQSLHRMHPSKHLGLNIIEALRARNLPPSYDQVRTITFRDEEAPTEAELFEDIFSHTKFFNHVTGETREEWTPKTFWKGWGAMRDHGNPCVSHHMPLVAFDVISRSEGISRCISEIPPVLRKKDVCIRIDDDESIMLYSVMTPGGSITAPHIDNSGSGHIILGTYGSKLVIWFDHDENLMKNSYGLIHCKKMGGLSLNAVKDWPGLRWAVLKPGMYLMMKPGSIHLVVSGENSSVSGWSFVSEMWLIDGTLRMMMEWEMEVVMKRLKEKVDKDDCDNPFVAGGPVEGMQNDLNLWQRWLDSNVLNRDLKKNLKELLKDMNKKMIVIEKKRV